MGDGFPAGIRDRYVARFREPERVGAICARYRAAATIDREQDLADRNRRPIRCPVLDLWSGDGAVGEWYEDPLAIWRRWAERVDGRAVSGGHFIPEEQPEIVIDALRSFMGDATW